MLKNQRKINRIAVTVITVCVILLVIGFVWNILSKWDKDPLSGFDWRFGFCESSFTLADESRLPKWVKLPMGVERSDIQIIFFTFSKILKLLLQTKQAIKYSSQLQRI